jgi:hypothetical protein
MSRLIIVGRAASPRQQGTRTREHLSEAEVERLIEATTSHRDATMILLALRHGLRWPVGRSRRRAQAATRAPNTVRGLGSHEFAAQLLLV